MTAHDADLEPRTLAEVVASLNVDLCEECGNELDDSSHVTTDGVWLCDPCYAELCAQWDAELTDDWGCSP